MLPPKSLLIKRKMSEAKSTKIASKMHQKYVIFLVNKKKRRKNGKNRVKDGRHLSFDVRETKFSLLLPLDSHKESCFVELNDIS